MAIDLGKRAEYIFAAEALARDLVPCWPSSAQYPFDLVVACATRTSRVQIKATSKTGSAIQVTAMKRVKSTHKPYTRKDVDFMAIYVAPQELWYVIPIEEIQGMGIYIKPENPNCRYARFKEAWSLLE